MNFEKFQLFHLDNFYTQFETHTMRNFLAKIEMSYFKKRKIEIFNIPSVAKYQKNRPLRGSVLFLL